jgi:VanZ family protein
MIRNNKFTLLTASIILILSFTNANSFQEIDFISIPYLDKIVHFGLYFLLMFVIILEHRKSFQNTRILILISLIPIIFGAFIEVGQSGLTATRKGDVFDMFFNSAGVICATLLWLIIKPYKVY